MALSSVKHNKPVLPRTSDGSDLGSNRASIYSGKGLSFDGVNDYVEISSPLMFNKHTYLGWYYRDSASNDDCLFDNRDANDDGVRALLTNGGNIFYQLNDTDVYTSFNESGKWMFLAFTYDGTTASIYYNGELFHSASVSETFSVTTNMKLGDSTYESRLWGGDMSDFKAFNVALNASQIKELYNNPELAVPTGVANTSLFMHLPMTEGAGSYLYNANANAIGTELISNAGFDETCQKWGTTDSSTVEISGGKAIWTNAPLSGSFVEQPLDLEVGKFYRVSFDYTSTAFNLFVNLGDTQQAVPLGNGRFTYDMYYGTGTSSLKFKHGYTSDSSASVDNVSVKEIVPNYYNGTINGATWVSGLPEPLPQTALMDWNKGTNLLTYSESFETGWSYGNTAITADQTSAPNNTFTADKSTINSSTAYHDSLLKSVTTTTGVLYEVSIYAKKGQGINGIYFYQGNGSRIAKWNLNDGTYIGHASGNSYNAYESYGSENAGNGWFRFWARYTASSSSGNFTVGISPNTSDSVVSYTGNGTDYLYIWGANYASNPTSQPSPYISTEATAQTSPVVIKEGSTAGKDVFGNTITNPRASGAYNFDGDSWAEVQDNASLDVTDAVTLECWFYWNEIISKGIFGRWHQDSNNRNYLLWKSSDSRLDFYINGSTIAQYYSLNAAKGWTHIVGTYDRNTAKIYVDGVNVASGSHTLAISTGTMPLEIGRNFTTSNQAINSQLSNVRLYNYALTAQQVADNFNEKASTFGGTKVASELDAYIERTASDGATVEAHSCLVNYLTELDKK